MKRKALGKGLAALLPDAPPGSVARGGIPLEVPLDRLDPNPDQPRQRMDEQKIEELSQSLAQQGVVQPIVVRKVGARFQIIAGERRWRAAGKAGLTHVPVVIRNVSDEQLLEYALVENIQREELTPIEEAAAYRRLIADFGYSQEQVAARVGKDRSTVANLLRLLRLPKEVRELMGEQKLSPGHARPLLTLDGAQHQIAIANEIVERGLSAREVERRVKAATAAPQKVISHQADPNTRNAQLQLETALGTRVKISRKGKGGRLVIDFNTEVELQRLYETLLRGVRVRN